MSDNDKLIPRDEHDRDRILDLLTPPAPSQTLRARLKRDFAPGSATSGHVDGAAFGILRDRIGAIAVAAALLLAVALGATMPPRETQVRPRAVQASVMAGDVGIVAVAPSRFEEEDDADFARATFAEGAPDSAAFMVATLDLARQANDPAADDAGLSLTESFGGLPLE